MTVTQMKAKVAKICSAGAEAAVPTAEALWLACPELVARHPPPAPYQGSLVVTAAARRRPPGPL